jgi:hypothetical protein
VNQHLLKPAVKKQKEADKTFAPYFTKQLEPLRVRESEISIKLHVEFEAKPMPEIFWYKDGFQMQSSEDFHIESTPKSTSLHIREAYKSDSGMYSVKIYTEGGVAQTRAYLAVIPDHLHDLTPTISLNLKDVTCKSGVPVKFEASGYGEDPLVISWYKDDEPLVLDDRVKTKIEGKMYTLDISKTYASDSGCYECSVENGHGKVYTRAYLIVLGDVEKKADVPLEFNQQGVRMAPMSSKFIQPAIEVPVKDTTVHEGAPAKFECVIAHSESEYFCFIFNFLNRILIIIVFCLCV